MRGADQGDDPGDDRGGGRGAAAASVREGGVDHPGIVGQVEACRGADSLDLGRLKRVGAHDRHSGLVEAVVGVGGRVASRHAQPRGAGVGVGVDDPVLVDAADAQDPPPAGQRVPEGVAQAVVTGAGDEHQVAGLGVGHARQQGVAAVREADDLGAVVGAVLQGGPEELALVERTRVDADRDDLGVRGGTEQAFGVAGPTALPDDDRRHVGAVPLQEDRPQPVGAAVPAGQVGAAGEAGALEVGETGVDARVDEADLHVLAAGDLVGLGDAHPRQPPLGRPGRGRRAGPLGAGGGGGRGGRRGSGQRRSGQQGGDRHGAGGPGARGPDARIRDHGVSAAPKRLNADSWSVRRYVT